MIRKSRTFTIGDIHGRHGALQEVLNSANFNFNYDTLITLGDTVDGGRYTKECFDLLLTIENRIDVIGNHDIWFYNWAKGGAELPLWTHQGGYQTLESYGFWRDNVPKDHLELLAKAKPYYIDKKNRIFVHGGFNPIIPIENQKTEFITWDRTLIKYAQEHVIKQFKHVFIGHTSTQAIYSGTTIPLTFNNLTMVDCGGGWMGKLAMINVDDLGDFYVSGTQIPSMYEEPPETEEMAWGDFGMKKPKFGTPDIKNPGW